MLNRSHSSRIVRRRPLARRRSQTSKDADPRRKLLSLAERWAEDLYNASPRSTASGMVPIELVHRQITERRERSFERVASRVLDWARAHSELALWEPQLEALRALILDLHHALDHMADPIDYLNPKRTMEKTLLPLHLRKDISAHLARLRRMCGDVPAKRRVLTPLGQRLWGALDGKLLMAKELARLLKRSPDSISKQIARLNSWGYVINKAAGSGYFRPDAPPKDAALGS